MSSSTSFWNYTREYAAMCQNCAVSVERAANETDRACRAIGSLTFEPIFINFFTNSSKSFVSLLKKKFKGIKYRKKKIWKKFKIDLIKIKMERKLRKLKKYSTQNNNKITTSRSQISKT